MVALSSNYELGFAGINFHSLPYQAIFPSIQFLDQLSFAVGYWHYTTTTTNYYS